MKRVFISSVLMFIATFLFAQKKAEAPAAAVSQTDCTVAFYIQDSIAAQLSGFKILADSVAVLRKEIDALNTKLVIANDKMLHQQNDSAVTVSDKNLNKKDKSPDESRVISDNISLHQNHLSILSQKMQTTYFDTIASVAKRVALSQNIKKITEINANYPMSCPTDQLIMIDITEAIIAEMKQE